jgi:hypothetical protein
MVANGRRNTVLRRRGNVAQSWHWLFVALAGLAVICVVPGPTLSQSRMAGDAIISTIAPVTSGSECGAVSCNPSSPSSPVSLPAVSVIGTAAVGIAALLALSTLRRVRKLAGTLPAGVPSLPLRPPQRLVWA